LEKIHNEGTETTTTNEAGHAVLVARRPSAGARHARGSGKASSFLFAAEFAFPESRVCLPRKRGATSAGFFLR